MTTEAYKRGMEDFTTKLVTQPSHMMRERKMPLIGAGDTIRLVMCAA